MAATIVRPYSQFNFLVDFSEGDTADAKAGFQEVTGLGVEVNIAEYRAGNMSNSPLKVTGTFKVPDVTFKRGIIAETDLYEWLHKVRSGDRDAPKDVIVQLLAENGEDEVQTWTLKQARPTKYTGPSLNAKGTDVAIEELVLACEDITLE